MPNTYGTFSWTRYWAISSPPFILGMSCFPSVVQSGRSLRNVSCGGEGHDPFFGHFVHGVARSFAAETAVLGAAVGHQVDARARRFVDVHATHLEFLRGRQRVAQAVGEQAGGQAEGRGVDAVHRL